MFNKFAESLLVVSLISPLLFICSLPVFMEFKLTWVPVVAFICLNLIGRWLLWYASDTLGRMNYKIHTLHHSVQPIRFFTRFLGYRMFISRSYSEKYYVYLTKLTYPKDLVLPRDSLIVKVADTILVEVGDEDNISN